MSLPNPQGLQKEVLYLPEKGNFVVLGTAGSGKTTLAILRAAYLAKVACLSDEKVMLITFNKALVTFLKSISNDSLKNVDVVNYHRFARGYLGSRGKLGYGDIIPAYSQRYFTKNDLIGKAYDLVKSEEQGITTFNRPVEVFIEEINWIQKMGIDNLKEYEEVERTGRSSIRITRNMRKYFFKVYMAYLELRREHNRKYDYEDLAYYVREELKQDDKARMYRHIIIDEGQDFSPTMLQSLSYAVPPHGSITYFGDVAQQIYGSRISWRSAGLSNPKIWKFEQNYRNTKEIANLGLAISQMPYFHEDADLIKPLFPRASGPLPALIEYKKEDEEIADLLDLIKESYTTQTIAILVRDRKMVKQIENDISRKNMPYQVLSGEMSTWNRNPGISVGTYHSAKGLEFDTVILPFCNKERLPAKEKIVAFESREDALAEDIKLLYVGVTRARRALLLSFTGEITELIPRNDNLYQEFKR